MLLIHVIAFKERLSPKGVPFFRLQVYERWISLNEVHDKVGNLSFRSVKIR